jgi:uncharacterized membrane protein
LAQEQGFDVQADDHLVYRQLWVRHFAGRAFEHDQTGWLQARVLVCPAGSIYVFIGIIYYYVRAMHKLDAEYHVEEEDR